MEQIEKGEKYTYGDIPVRQDNCHEKAHMKLSKHFKMRRVATKYMSHYMSKKCKSVIHGRQHPILLGPYCAKVMSESPFSFTMEPTSIFSQLNFGKIPRVVTFFMCLLTTGGRGQPCYM